MFKQFVFGSVVSAIAALFMVVQQPKPDGSYPEFPLQKAERVTAGQDIDWIVKQLEQLRADRDETMIDRMKEAVGNTTSQLDQSINSLSRQLGQLGERFVERDEFENRTSKFVSTEAMRSAIEETKDTLKSSGFDDSRVEEILRRLDELEKKVAQCPCCNTPNLSSSSVKSGGSTGSLGSSVTYCYPSSSLVYSVSNQVNGYSAGGGGATGSYRLASPVVSSYVVSDVPVSVSVGDAMPVGVSQDTDHYRITKLPERREVQYLESNSTCYRDPVTGVLSCDQSQTASPTYRPGLLGRRRIR